MERIFNNKENASLYIQDRIVESRSLLEIFPGLEEELTGAFEEVEYPKSRPGALNLLVPIYRWVIKDEDLELMRSLLEGFQAAAGANFFIAATSNTGNASVAAAIGLFSAVYKILTNARRKGATLAKDQFLVIACLKRNHDGLTFEQLYSAINIAKPVLDKAHLEHVLQSLKSVYSDSGSKMEILIYTNNFYKVAGV